MSFDVESIFGAIDVIVSNRLDGISYDTTMICTIVDDRDKDRSHYVVTDGSIRFDAYTNDTSYKVDDVVRVSVLNGDFSQRKFIVGPYIGDDTSAPVTYIPPLATSFTSTENLVSKFNGTTDFILKTNNTRKKQLWRVNLQDNEEYRNLQANGIYNVITLAADFKTDLGDLASGNYGLRLDLLIQNDLSGESYVHKFVTLDSEEMVGNPYSFGIYSNQAKQVQITTGGIVAQIALYAYEGVKFVDKTVENDGISTVTYEEVNNEFKYSDGSLLSPSKDIYIRDVVVAFGSDLTKVENNTLQLFTNSSILYTYGVDGNDNNLIENKKNLAFNWYNKTENNEYIGFGDGLDYKVGSSAYNYDEIAYNELNYSDQRLMAQKEQSGIASDMESLTLAANIAEAKPLMIEAYTLLVTQLPNVLQTLKYQLNGTSFINGVESDQEDERVEGINKLINGNDALLTKYSKDAENATNTLAQYYKSILEYGYNIQNGEDVEWNNVNKKKLADGSVSEEILFNIDTDYYVLNYLPAIKNAINDVKVFFNSLYEHTAANKPLSGYRGLYDVYYPRAMEVLEKIASIIDRIPITVNNNGNNEVSADFLKLKAYNSKTDYREYASDINFDNYANRYCIYWYRYNKNYVLRHISPISLEEWEKMVNKEHSTYSEYLAACEAMNKEYKYANFAGYNWERITEFNNVGLPIGPQDKIVTKDGKNYLPVRSMHDWTQEVSLNPKTKEEKFKVILFYNHNKIESNVITFTNKDTFREEALVDAQDILIIDHHQDSQEHYSAYNETYELNDIRDENQARLIKCSYDGLFSKNEALIGAGLYWYVPITSTMLSYDLEYLKEQGFATDADSENPTPNSRNGFVYFYKQVGEEDEEYEDYDNDGNKVTKVRKTAKVSDLIFTYKIKPYYEQSAQNNTIEAWSYIPGTTDPVKGNISFTFSTSGTSGTKYTLSVTPATAQIAVLPNNNDLLKLKLSLYDSLNKQLAINRDSIIINNIEENPSDAENKSEGYNLKLSWYGYHNPYYNITYTESPPNSKDIYITITHTDQQPTTNAANDKFVGILKAVVQFDLNNTDGIRVADLVTLYPISFAANKDLYIQGSTSIIYNNQGVVAKLSQSPYALYQHQNVDESGNMITTGDLHINDEQLKWFIKYYDEDGAYILEDDLISSYMPLLNNDYTLVPAPLYLDCPDDERYTPMVMAVKNSSILWTQPILIIQNKYGAPILNDWDGSFKIDEANGTIMSTMLGAGKKTERNTFEGVLIGDITKPTNGFDPNNAAGIGIYGFNDGAQSFYFGVDGTAFIGKSGRGRIKFDGNSGTIASASYYATRTNYESMDGSGMLIDLDDGFIDIKGVINATDLDYTGSVTYEKDVNHQARITLNAKADALNPYFRITSPRINTETEWEDMDLVYVGLDGYYLQSSNYRKPDTAFAIADNYPNTPGSGMKIDLQGAFIDAFNLRLQSQNLLIDCVNEDGPYFVIKSGATDKELTSFRNLMYIGTDTYYLQTADYKNKTSGLKIDLANGSIKAYNSFSLEAGTETNGGVMLNAQPGSGENYLFAGKTSVGYIKIDNSGNMSLMATVFTLKTNKNDGQDIYLSNTITSWTLGSGDSASSKSNILFGVGTKFAVDNKGNLYANDATINNLTAVGGTFSGTISSSATISGGTIMGAVIKNGNGSFKVTKEGHLTASSANIGGWTVGPANSDTDGFRSGRLIMSPSMGLNYNENFTVDAEGNLKATSAVFDKSLTVKAQRNGATVLEVNNTGQTKISGKLYVDGHYIYLDKDGTNGYIYTNGDVFYIKNTTWFYAQAKYIALEGSVGIGANQVYTDRANSIRVGGDVYYIGDIYCSSSNEDKGVNGTITYVSGSIFGGAKKTATFKKGILVEATDIEEGETETGEYTLPALGEAGTVLTSDGSNATWSYLKKNFDLSLSGKILEANHNYYSPSATETYTLQGSSTTAYTITGGPYYPQTYYSTAPITTTKPNGTYYSIKGVKCNYAKYDISSGIFYKAGTSTVPVYSKVGDITITAIKDSHEITLQGGDTADNAIDVTISDATITLS